MFRRPVRHAAAAALCVLAFAAAAARASGDITVVNTGGETIQPYFRTNCWLPEFTAFGADRWVAFRPIAAESEFSWPEFGFLLDPDCRHPVLAITFTTAGEPDPARVEPQRTVLIHYDASQDYLIVVGDGGIVTQRP